MFFVLSRALSGDRRDDAGLPLVTVDLDGVLCEPPLGLNLTTHGAVMSEDKRTRVGWLKRCVWRTEPIRYYGRRRMRGADAFLRQLAPHCRLYLVTARGVPSARHTRGWLKHNGLWRYLDGLVFRANLHFWRKLHHRPARVIYGSAVSSVAALVAVLLMLVPLALAMEVVPALAGTAVPIDYQPPPPAPPASEWSQRSTPASTSEPAKPHSDHEPHHGGVVTMAGDLHIEIVVRKDGTILCYPSDEIRRPIPLQVARGTVHVESAGQARTIPLTPDSSGALIGQGPVPAAQALYTYALQVHGESVSMTIAVPTGGTDLLVRSAVGAG